MGNAAEHAAITAHWSRRDPAAWIMARLAAEQVQTPQWRDVARFDQIHAGGLQAVRELAELCGISRDWQVVDLGGGLGGAARALSGTYGCALTCVDLTPTLIDAGERLTTLVGLQRYVRHLEADATATGLADAAYDLVWVQHLALHLPEPLALWREAARLLKPGGLLAVHEWVLGSGEPYYPAPWAPADGSLSHLGSQAELEARLTAAGFIDIRLQDVSATAAEGYARQLKALARQPQADNPVLPAEELGLVIANAERSLREGRARCLMGTARRA